MPSIAEPVTIPKRTVKTDASSKGQFAPTYVFMKLFGWERQKAEKHMMEVHEKGKSVLVREGAEKAEFYVHQLQNYKLQATMEPAE